MFGPKDAALHKGIHSLMLDGSKGSFVLSTAGPRNLVESLDPLRWAWSANVSHAVSITGVSGRQATVRRWDDPNLAEDRLIENASDARALVRSFEQSPEPPSAQSVIARGLKTFRAIRIAIEKQEGSAVDVVLAFNTVLAWVAQLSGTHSDTEIDFTDAVRTLHNTGQISFTPRQISPQLRHFPLGDLARLLRAGDTNLVPYLLDADLLIRHASGPLYQEAHKELLVPTDREKQDELFPRDMLIVGSERPHAPAPTFVHHTPSSLARVLVEVALHSLENADEVLDILDPACGSGIFLIESIRQISIQKNLPQRVNLRGFDTSELAVAMADFCLRNANPLSGSHSMTIQQENSLAIEDWGAPHIIAMNPPFRAWEALDNYHRDLVKRTLGPLHKGRPDLAFAFIVRALKSLKLGGVMAALVPPSFLDSRSAEAIRAYILRSDEFQVRLIGHFHDFNYFDAAVEPSFIVVSRSARETSIPIITAKTGFVDNAIRALRSGKAISRAGYELYLIDRNELTPDRWTPQTQRNLRFVKAITTNTSHTVSDFFVPHLGIRPGKKSVFIVSEKDIERICPTIKERRFFRPIADRITAGQIQSSGYVFYPYDTGGRLLLPTEQELKSAVPHFYNERLRPAEEALKGRKSLYRKWWEVTEPVATWLAPHTPRIVSQAFGRAGNFAFDKEGKYAVVQGVGWCWKHGHPDEDTMLAYLALLNSAVFDELLPSFCPRVRGGQYQLYRRFVEKIPLPQLADSSLRDLLSQIGRAITEGRIYDADTQNKLVLRAYGLSSEGKPLDGAEHRQGRIVREFRESVSEHKGEISGPAPVDAQIVEIAELPEGWFGPDSNRLDPTGLENFRNFMNHILDQGSIPIPYIYPTPEGGVQAEWSFQSWEVSATASLTSGALYLHATHLESDDSRDVETKLYEVDAIHTFLEFMSEFTR
jgi:hypothetical protein